MFGAAGIAALHLGAQTGSAWSSWSADPIALIGLPLAALLYARGLRSLGHRRRFHDSWRPAAFYAGLAIIFVALVSPIDHLSDELFFVHMMQHVLLMLVAAPAVLLSAPMIPLLRGVPRPLRRSLVGPIARALPVRLALRTLTAPPVAWVVFVLVFTGWHFPFAFEAALRNEGVHLLEHLLFASAAYLYWWNVIDPIPLRPNLSYLVRIPYIFITIAPAFVLGAFLTFATSAWYEPYQATTAAHGLTALDDQQIGGVVMWIPGSFIFATALLIDLLYVVRTEQADQLAKEAGSPARRP